MNKLLLLSFLLLILITKATSAQSPPEKDTCLHVPAILTPQNPHLNITCSSCFILKFEFKLYNRWGEVLYETKKLSDPLDFSLFEETEPNKRGVSFPKYPSGVYVWVANYTVSGDSKHSKKTATGSIQIQGAK